MPTQIDTTNLSAIAGVSFEDFKTYYNNSIATGSPSQADRYYQELADQAASIGDQALGDYADRMAATTNNSDFMALQYNKFLEHEAGLQGVDMSRGSDDWLRYEYDRMQADLNARSANVLTGGTGSLGVDALLAIEAQALENLGLTPDVNPIFIPLMQAQKTNPATAQDIFNNYNDGNGSLTDYQESLREMLYRPAIDTGNNPSVVAQDIHDRLQWARQQSDYAAEVLSEFDPFADDFLESFIENYLPFVYEIPNPFPDGLLEGMEFFMDLSATWLDKSENAVEDILSRVQAALENWWQGSGSGIDTSRPQQPAKEVDRKSHDGASDGSDNDGGDNARGKSKRQEDQEEGKKDGEEAHSPLVLDLGGNGQIDLSHVLYNQAYFDIDGDGLAESVGWVDETSGDGFLVYDRNADGIINNITELFGNDQEHGFVELALLDSNLDGVIDSNDTEFSELQIWVDANGNGYSEEAELFTLADFDIASISVANSRIDGSDAGNAITNVGTFSYENGEVGNISDVWFATDDWNSVYNGTYELDFRTIFMPTVRGYGDVADLHVAMSLDNSPGGLLEMVQELAILDLEGWLTKDFAELTADLDAIMYRWAGVQEIDPASRAYFGEVTVDARKIHYIEEMTAEPFYFRAGWFKGPNPPVAAGRDLERTFFDDQMAVAARLFMQGTGLELFSPVSGEEIYYDISADVLQHVGTLNSTTISDLVALAQMPEVDALELWTNVLMIVTGVRGGPADITTADQSTLDAAIQASDASLDYVTVTNFLYGYNPGETVPSTTGDDVLHGAVTDDLIQGSDGNDLIYGHDGNDTLIGSFDNDTMYGGAGHDILDDAYGENAFYGGTGGDILKGGSLRDRYYFNVGDGDDAIQEGFQSGTHVDEIIFGEGITLSDLTFVRIDNMALGIGIDQSAGGGSISVERQFDNYNYRIELIRFHDNSTFDPNSISYTLEGTGDSEHLYGVENGAVPDDTILGGGGNDSIFGYDGADALHGGDGDDTIYAFDTSGEHTDTNAHILTGGDGDDLIRAADGNDEITGGADDDVVFGYSGNDTYHFEYGDGHDTITDDAGTEVIELGAGIVEADLSYNIVGDDLTIIIDGGAGGSITIDRQFYSAAYVVETLLLDDSTTLDLLYQDYEWSGTSGNDNMYGRDFAGSQDIIHGLDGNDNIYGYDGRDILYGGAGDDYIDAEYGDDIVYGGDGVDTIRGDYGNDILSGGDGNDDVRGGSGDDVISGGLGDDYLNGEGGYSDKVDYSSSATAVTINFQTGTATGEGTDTLLKFEEADGSAYDDTFSHDYYTNAFDGKDGSDTLDYSVAYRSNYSMTVNLATGTSSGSGAAFTFTSIENVIGRSGADNITGDDGANRLEGRNGTDTISGAGGNDLIYGGEGSDTLSGGDGNDVLYGGNGADSMTGGNGADIFTFLSGETGTKTITDFTTGDGDALDIADLLTGYDPGTDLITDFLEITDSGSDSIVRVDADGGADSFVQIAMLTGVTGLTDEEALETSGNLIAA